MQTITLRFAISAMLAAIGVAGLVIALDYDFGTARQMGPGYFPVILSILLTLLAVSEMIGAFLKPEAQTIDWRPMIAILAAVLGFGICMRFFGMIPAFFAVIGLSVLSEKGYGFVPAAVLATVTCAFAWLLFSRLLGMPLPLIRWDF
ncbi:tripartite tricarboxylate transporter TctB family protein [Frigidibacter oleivorans]|uniref:tripartite tricarboxylate transporter TctB family protein n=1 Tax=Frigidibacter oleivorans TaxID=2487129 RepID=UPI000F8F2098|nr:tripartite tricarboxylate transporter TctB family protein [Frigidibacter oleivorans]